MLKSLVCWIPAVACWAFLACASLDHVDTCDPAYVSAKLQAMGLECRAQRIRECGGVPEALFERDPSTCLPVAESYAAFNAEAVRCDGR